MAWIITVILDLLLEFVFLVCLGPLELILIDKFGTKIKGDLIQVTNYITVGILGSLSALLSKAIFPDFLGSMTPPIWYYCLILPAIVSVLLYCFIPIFNSVFKLGREVASRSLAIGVCDLRV